MKTNNILGSKLSFDNDFKNTIDKNEDFDLTQNGNCIKSLRVSPVRSPRTSFSNRERGRLLSSNHRLSSSRQKENISIDTTSLVKSLKELEEDIKNPVTNDEIIITETNILKKNSKPSRIRYSQISKTKNNIDHQIELAEKEIEILTDNIYNNILNKSSDDIMSIDDLRSSNNSNPSIELNQKLKDLKQNLKEEIYTKTQTNIPNHSAYTIYCDGILNFRKKEFIKDSINTQICFVCDNYIDNIIRFIAATERKENYLNRYVCTIYREINLCQSCSNKLGFCCISKENYQKSLLSRNALSFYESSII